MVTRHVAMHSDLSAQARLRARLEELRSLIPELPEISRATDRIQFSIDLLDLLEGKQRQLIQENVRLASLRELTETLLRDPEEERVLRTISLYLRQAHGLPEVMILLKTDSGGLRGYRASAGANQLCEPIDWKAGSLLGTVWERALAGESVNPVEGSLGETPGRARAGTELGVEQPIILPLHAGSRAGRAGGAQRDGSTTVMGLLALRPNEETGAGRDPFEIEQLVFLTATLLESIRHQRQTMIDRRFRECLLESMEDALIAVDSQGRITAANRAAHGLLGLGDDSILGTPIESLHNRAPQVVEICRKCLRDQERVSHREVWISPDGQRIPVRLSVVPLAENPEEGDGVVATLSDLRPLRAMEEELRRLDRLAALGRFAAAVAHEIRNPLAAIGAGVEFLGAELGPEKEADLGMLRSEVTRLDRIVSDLLEPVRTRSLTPERVQVEELVARACETVTPHATEHRVSIRMNPGAGEDDEPIVVEVDRDRLLQVLINLVRNSVEASPQGSSVEVGWGREENAPGRIRIWIRDEGCGIEPEQLEHIFEPFYSTKSSGTGLGLYVSNCIVEQHGGRLQVESLPEGGARATVYLPLPPE